VYRRLRTVSFGVAGYGARTTRGSVGLFYRGVDTSSIVHKGGEAHPVGFEVWFGRSHARGQGSVRKAGRSGHVLFLRGGDSRGAFTAS
jgi:hypothetical protein